jgi:tripartite-type tricarboxylate transporter receptor subunit TctC
VNKRHVKFLCLSVMLWVLSVPFGLAQTYPDQPIRIIVPAAAGGVGDVFVRKLVGHMSATLGQPVVVDNRPGANGFIGAEAVARAKPDGYTVMYAAVNVLCINPALFPTLPYDPVRDFAPVSLMARGYPILLVSPKLPVKTLADFIEYAKAHPGQVTYGSPAVGSPQHVTVKLLEQLTGAELVHVPYKNQPQVITDLIGGQIDAAVEYPSVAVPQVKAGKVRALAIVGPRRKPSIPEVPTAPEAGLPGFELAGWAGFVVPAGTPPQIVAKLNKAIVAALGQSEFLEWVASNATEAVPSTPKEFASYIKTETVKWSKIIKDANVKVE